MSQPAWTPFTRALPYHGGKPIPEELLGGEMWMNSRYVVIKKHLPVIEEWPRMVWLSIRRVDRGAVHDWRDLQRIKNELVGQENEGVEVYPAESRLADSANQYHLWVFSDSSVRLPFGFVGRCVSGASSYGAVQRPFNDDNLPQDVTPETETSIKQAHKDFLKQAGI